MRDDGLVVVVEVLDGVLDRHDVARARSRDVVEHGGDRGRLAAAGRTHDQDQSLTGLGHLLQDGRQVQGLERWDVGTDPAGDQADHAALAEDVDAEAVLPAHLVGEVHRPVGDKELFLGRTHDLVDQFLHPLGGEGLGVGVLELAVEPQFGRLAHLQVDVVGLRFDRGLEKLVQLGFFDLRLLRVKWLFRTHTLTDSLCKNTAFTDTTTTRSSIKLAETNLYGNIL